MGCFVKIAFLDDDREDSVGKLDDVEEFCTEYSCAISTCDDGMKRAKLNNRLKEATYIVPQIVHLSCSVSLSFGMGEGCILEPGAVIGSKSTLGKSVIIGANSVVENNCFFYDGCWMKSGTIAKTGSVVVARTVSERGTILFDSLV